jgi:UDP-glucose 4-epimerase
MSDVRVRSGRTTDGLRSVVVGESPVGRALAHALGAGRVVPSGGLTPGVLDGVDVVVLVGHSGDFAAVRSRRAADRREDIVTRTASDVSRAAAAHVGHVVGVSSAMVNGASPGRPVIEDDEPAGGEADDGIVGDLLTFEETFRDAVTAASTRPRATVLRPACLVGPGVDTLMTRHFEAPRILTVRGVSREWQLVHVDDVAAAVEVVVRGGLVGALTVGPRQDGVPDVLSSAEVLHVAGMRSVDLPRASAFGAAERLHRLGVLPAPASDMTFAVYPWTVSAAGLHAAGWSASRTSEECLRLLVDQVRGRVGVAGRRVGGRDAAAAGATGAAVAVLGTAAIWKRARRGG